MIITVRASVECEEGVRSQAERTCSAGVVGAERPGETEGERPRPPGALEQGDGNTGHHANTRSVCAGEAPKTVPWFRLDRGGDARAVVLDGLEPGRDNASCPGLGVEARESSHGDQFTGVRRPTHSRTPMSSIRQVPSSRNIRIRRCHSGSLDQVGCMAFRSGLE